MSKRKLKEFERVIAVREYLEGDESQKSCAQRLGIGESTFRDWVVKYKDYGSEGLCKIEKKRYSSQIKLAAVQAYLQEEGSLAEICRKYKIKDRKTLRSWLKEYNGHTKPHPKEEQRSGVCMTKAKATTLAERIEIVGYCLEQSKDYAAAVEKYGVSYQQIYAWVKKYEKQGAVGLEDRRGKRKDISDMNETEKLRAENRLLQARIKRAELENIVLKKLEEAERRGC